MSYTTTTRLALQKAVVGSNQAFETSVINSNWDKVDAEAVAADVRLDALEAADVALDGRLDAAEADIDALQAVTASGVVYNSARVGGRTVFAQSGTPTALAVGDIWVQV